MSPTVIQNSVANMNETIEDDVSDECIMKAIRESMRDLNVERVSSQGLNLDHRPGLSNVANLVHQDPEPPVKIGE